LILSTVVFAAFGDITEAKDGAGTNGLLFSSASTSSPNPDRPPHALAHRLGECIAVPIEYELPHPLDHSELGAATRVGLMAEEL
jgi:hypothetical protein